MRAAGKKNILQILGKKNLNSETEVKILFFFLRTDENYSKA